MKFLSLSTAFVVFALATPAVPAQGPRATDKVTEITSTELRRAPENFKGVAVRFPVQFCATGRVFNPFFTAFTPSEFANFSVWGAEQAIWLRSEYDNPFGYMFVSKRVPELIDQVMALKVYEQFMLSGVVRSTFQGTPWVEVTAIQRMDQALNTETLAHMFRGSQLMENRRWALAIGELALANADGIPSRVIGEIHKMIGICHLRMGEAAKAAEQFDLAQGNIKNDAELTALSIIATKTPEAGIDRVVTAAPLKDAERPMWEAFERSSVRGSEPRPQPQAQPQPGR